MEWCEITELTVHYSNWMAKPYIDNHFNNYMSHARAAAATNIDRDSDGGSHSCFACGHCSSPGAPNACGKLFELINVEKLNRTDRPVTRTRQHRRKHTCADVPFGTNYAETRLTHHRYRCIYGTLKTAQRHSISKVHRLPLKIKRNHRYSYDCVAYKYSDTHVCVY